jgi:hypothetical protein
MGVFLLGLEWLARIHHMMIPVVINLHAIALERINK